MVGRILGTVTPLVVVWFRVVWSVNDWILFRDFYWREALDK